jgi:glycosyltransferase involved in cell wall biosynthesis
MKILIDMQSLQAGSSKGGIGRYAYNLLEAILKNNILNDIHILLNANLSLHTCAKLHTIIPKEKIHKFYAFSDTQEKIQENYIRSKVSELTREYVVSLIDPDIFFISSLVEGYLDNVVASVGKIFPAYKTAVVLYDLIPLVQKEKYLTNPLAKRHYMQKISDLSESGLLLSISEFSRQEALELLQIKKENIINISSGVDEKFKVLDISSHVKEKLFKKYHIKDKIILYTSSFDIRKNQKNLILAFASLDYKLRKEYQLLLIGNGTKEVFEQLKTIASDSGLSDDEVIFLGYIDEVELLNFYNLASLFVFPSFSEGFGLPALEAMSCGVPTIGSNTTSIVEVISNSDAFFDPSSVSSITAKMKQVLLDEDFANTLALRGLTQSKNFSWAITALKTLEALQNRYEKISDKPQKYTNMYDTLIQKISKIKDIQNFTDAQLIETSDFIDKNLKLYNKKIGIISTYNTRCGIASYTRYLSQSFINDSIILAPRTDEKNLTANDEENVKRVWQLSHDDLAHMLEYILNSKLQTIFIQFNYGFFDFTSLNQFINHLVDCDIAVHITFHSTTDDPNNKDKKLFFIKNALNRCKTIFIHTKKDKVNLEKLGLKQNVVLLNQGILETSFAKETNKQTTHFTLATYGFFLQSKGFIDMIEAFNILSKEGYHIKLLMLNAKYNDAASNPLIEKANELINTYNLKNEINLNTKYLSDQESIFQLSRTDLVVYPYKNTGESSSAAVRMAIAAKTHIAITPQSIFDEVKDFSFIFDGDSVSDLVNGIKIFIQQIQNNETIVKQMSTKREKFRKQNLYSKLSKVIKKKLI